MGKSAAGKDTLFQTIMGETNLPLKTVVPYTTRPMRENEREGREYHFCTEEELSAMKRQGRVIECRRYDTVFGPWYYFTADDGQIDLRTSSYLVIGTPDSCASFADYFGPGVIVPLYVAVDDGVRLERALQREREQKKPRYAEMCRRFLADEKDFSQERLESLGITSFYDNNDLRTCADAIERDIAEKIGGQGSH
jgi:guanylate kinase